MNLPSVAAALAGYHERRNGVGLVDMHDKKQFDSEERFVACLHTTYLMRWDETKVKELKHTLPLLHAQYCAMTYDTIN